jgi:hypothetical protein
VERGMSKQFKVGQICIGQGFSIDVQLNGMECEIISPLQYSHLRSRNTGESYGICAYHMVRWASGHEDPVRIFHLRPKRPPPRDIDEVVRWESVGWMPMDVKLDRAIREMLRNQVRERA